MVISMENRYKKIREDYEFTKHGHRMTMEELADIFKMKGYSSLTYSAIRKIETNNRNVSEHELKGYCEVFNTTSDYLLGIRDTKLIDENIAMINRVTGLSDNSINTLKKIEGLWSKKEKNTLNYIMKDTDLFIDFLEWLSIYIDNEYIIPLAYDKEKGLFPCDNPLNSVVLGKKVKDNKGNDGFEIIGIGIDILESHAMLKMQEIINTWKNLK